MKGQMKVKKLNDTGLYISEMDWDNTYICKENPIGNFVMVIEPLSGFDGGIIYFDKKTDGFLHRLLYVMDANPYQRYSQVAAQHRMSAVIWRFLTAGLILILIQ